MQKMLFVEISSTKTSEELSSKLRRRWQECGRREWEHRGIGQAAGWNSTGRDQLRSTDESTIKLAVPVGA